jgi:antitoxin (DNA-binding transcriptional repressor) of toxin-antitoxin stability system
MDEREKEFKATQKIMDKLAPGEELIITRNNPPIARLVGQQRPVPKPRQPPYLQGYADHHLR